MTIHRRNLTPGTGFAAGIAIDGPAFAQAFPTKPVTMLIPFAPPADRPMSSAA